MKLTAKGHASTTAKGEKASPQHGRERPAAVPDQNPAWTRLATGAPILQAKLTVGAADDPFEFEADRVAERVMRMAAPDESPPRNRISGHPGPPVLRRVCAECEEERRRAGETARTGQGAAPVVRRMCAECEEELQRKPRAESQPDETLRARAEGGAPTPAVSRSTESAIRALPGGGSSLSDASLGFFQPRLGADLSGVRVHTGSRAAETARDLSSRAYAFGNHIVFGPGQYRPGTEEGRHLIAHELAHVLQQSGRLAPRGADADAPLRRTPEEGEPETGGVLPAVGSPAGGAETAGEAPEPRLPTRPSSPAFTFGTYETGYYSIADDREFMKYEMTRLIGDKGLEGATRWVSNLQARQGRAYDDPARPFSAHTMATRRRVRSPIDVEREMRADSARREIAPSAIPTAVAAFREVYREAVTYLAGFEESARNLALSLLETSEQKAEAERARYGLERREVLGPDWSPDEFGVPERPYSIYAHSMRGEGPSAGLAGAAKDLKAKRDEIQSLRERRQELERLRWGESFWSGLEAYVPDESRPQHDSLSVQLEAAETQYNVLRAIYERRYPILASFADDPSAIAKLAEGPGARSAEILNDQIYETLGNIAKVRRELRSGGRVKIWKLPEIVHLTKVATRATGGSVTARMRSKVVDDRRREIEDEEFWRNLALGALALGLALLAAIPTGGSSLAVGVAAVAALGSLGLNVYIASESLQEYNLQKAMTGTDFDRAQAISAEDPSLFWLAVDIAGAMLEVGPALKATRMGMVTARNTFRRLAPLARRAVTAQGPELADSLKALRRAAANDELYEAVERSVRGLRRGEAQQAIGRAAGHEAAARAGLDAAALGRPSTTVIGGHTVRVAPGSGALVICSECIWARGMFATELAENAQLMTRLETLEEAGRAAAAADDAAAASRVAEQTKQLADELMALRRARLSTATRALNASEIEELGRLRGLDPADMSQAELESLQSLREASGEAFGGRLAANTPDHKAERWLEYRARGGEWPYDRWSKSYQQNMRRAARSHALVEAHHARIGGWGTTQVVTRPFGPGGPRRILDIGEEVLDPLTGQRTVLRGVEHKEGYITMSDPIRAEIAADKELVRKGADITWYVEGRASQGLRDALAEPPPIPLQETLPDTPIKEIRGSSQ